VNEKLDANFAVSDLRTVDLRNRFDAIYNWSGSFGTLPTQRMLMCCDDWPWLSNLVVAYLLISRIVSDCCAISLTKIRRNLVRHNRWSAVSQRVESALYVDSKEEPMTFSSVRLYTPKQFQRLLAEVGLSLETVYGGQDFSSYSRSSDE